MRSDPGRRDEQIQTLLLDIEGTTTPVDFVYKVLFPYARARVEDFIRRRWSSELVAPDLRRLAQEHAADLSQGRQPPPWGEDQNPESVIAYVHWLMDQDRKSTGLKSIQGKIWQAGYEAGELQGEVFPDVPGAFVRWRARKRSLCIFSSGSVLAQRLLFSGTNAGDLTPYIWKYFDTTTGPKEEPESYRTIAAACARSPEEMLFISDVTSELDAARAVGLNTALCVRGEVPESTGSHPVIRTFDEIA
jgi:enolase-phosphatase E1